MQLFNQFSYGLLVLVGGGLLVLGLTRVTRVTVIAKIALVAVYIIVVVGISIVFRYPDSPIEADSIADVENILANGTSTFVMLYSNY